jgi:hypothetical protein
MRGATAGDERWDCSNFSAARKVVTNDLQIFLNPPRASQLNDVPVVSCDNNSASTGPFPLFDVVNFIETLPGVSSLELFSQIIVTDASGVHHGFWREDVLDQPRDQNAYEVRFGKGHALQHHEQRFARLPQQHR